MPTQTYEITAPNGKVLSITGDHVPSEVELHDIFAKAGVATGAAQPPPAESHISASAPPLVLGGREYLSGLPGDADKVTLEDMRDHPMDSIQRIGAQLKKDVTDPRLWLALAASYFGPKAFNMAGPLVARAARSIAEAPVPAIRNLDPDLMSIASPRAGAFLRRAQRVVDALPTKETPPSAPGYDRYMPNASGATASAPAESVLGGTPPLADPPPPVAPVESPAGPSVQAAPARPALRPHPDGGVWSPTRIASEVGLQARRQSVTLTAEEDAAAQTMVGEHGALPKDAVATIAAARTAPAKLKMSPDETTQYLALRSAGKSGGQAEAAILKMRALAAKMGTPSGEQVSDAVARRNQTGRWEP